MIAEKEYTVLASDVDAENRITNKALMEELSGVTKKYDASFDIMPVHPKGFVVVNWKIRVLRRPALGETIKLKTVIVEWNRFFILRNHIVFDKEGNAIVVSSSRWARVDRNERGINAFEETEIRSDLIEERFHDAPDTVFAKYNLNRSETDTVATVKIGTDLIDDNVHLHNSHYISFAEQAIESSEARDSFDIFYKKEIMAGYEIDIKRLADGNGSTVLLTNAKSGALHAVIEFGK